MSDESQALLGSIENLEKVVLEKWKRQQELQRKLEENKKKYEELLETHEKLKKSIEILERER